MGNGFKRDWLRAVLPFMKASAHLWRRHPGCLTLWDGQETGLKKGLNTEDGAGQGGDDEGKD